MNMLDRVLRQREGYFEEIFEGKSVGARIRWFLVAIFILSGFYGLAMGATDLAVDVNRGMLQMVSTAVKVPLLFLLSVAVCYPVLFIVIVLMGSRLSFLQAFALILLALTLNSVLLASCAPIVLFFIFTGSDYDFVKLLHVLIFAFSGAWAMKALSQGLRIMCEKSDLYPKQAIKILQVWILVFGLVGTQMAWSLRPFVGSPELTFQLFRADQEGNFYKAVANSVKNLTLGPNRSEP
ncbi:MAG: actin-binding WH2 domain-containing protein [Verrucomicrobia bacterium]|nr:actin-binding WH2 domain-containing protein [Verrucomicrobiota bacterium]